MIHPALIQQLATGHIDDLLRGAAEHSRLDSSRNTTRPQDHRTLPARGRVGSHATSSGEVTSSSSLRVQSFTRAHARAALDMFAAEGWGTYTVDPERTVRALSAPGCTTLIALDGTTVVALVQLQSDGEIQAHLSALIVARSWHRRGLGRQLLHEALKRAGGIRIDVLTQTEAFYESLGGQRTPGFRLIQQDLNLDEKPDHPPASLPGGGPTQTKRTRTSAPRAVLRARSACAWLTRRSLT